MLRFWLIFRVVGYACLGLFGLNYRWLFCCWCLRIWMIFFAEVVYESLIIQAEAVAPLLTMIVHILSFILGRFDKFFGWKIDIFQKAFEVLRLMDLILHIIELQVNLDDIFLSCRWLWLRHFPWNWSRDLKFVWILFGHRRWRYEWFTHFLIIKKSLNSPFYDA